jgi:inner membrane protease subunit 2
MQPTINPNSTEDIRSPRDWVLKDKWAVWRWTGGFDSEPRILARGDVVALTLPQDPTTTAVKRVVGLPGELISTPQAKGEKTFTRVPAGKYWLESDNVAIGKDSNSFGPVPHGLIQAKVTMVVWPPSRWSKLQPTDHSQRVLSSRYTPK